MTPGSNLRRPLPGIDCVCRYIARNHTIGADHGSVSDSHTAQYATPTPNPDSISDFDFARNKGLGAYELMPCNPMVRVADTHILADERIITDRYAERCGNRATRVDSYVRTERDHPALGDIEADLAS
jgi:hypothetical protein